MFSLIPEALHVTKAGTGSGHVTSDIDGIDCGAACSADYPYGTVVTLTAAPDAGMTFGGWTGACSGSSSTCQVTLDQARSVTATFAGAPVALHVSTDGSGSGAVSSDPAGIDCASACDASFPAGTVVTLTALPDPGMTFSGWSGACSGASITCQVTLSRAASVKATFTDPIHLQLQVGTTGTGGGRITSDPSGIDCGTDCTETYDVGTTITLTATPVAGSSFDGWSGSCTGTATTCQLTLGQAASVTASFDAVDGHPGACTIRGTRKADVLTGTRGADVICGLGGNDKINGLRGNDVIRGGAGADTLIGVRGDDVLIGGAGQDLLIGGQGSDRCNGGAALDRYRGCETQTAEPRDLNAATESSAKAAPLVIRRRA